MRLARRVDGTSIRVCGVDCSDVAASGVDEHWKMEEASGVLSQPA